MFTLRALDPTLDASHLHEAFSWRAGRRLEQAQRAEQQKTFDEFRETPGQIAMGLFNGTLHAVYFIQDRGNGSFEVHFSTRRRADREAARAGAIQLKDWLFEQGAREVFGWIAKENRALRGFARSIGFFYCGISSYHGTSSGVVEWMRHRAER